MKQFICGTAIAGDGLRFSACGDKKDSADKAAGKRRKRYKNDAKRAKMMEGNAQGAENLDKKATEQKEETKK